MSGLATNRNFGLDLTRALAISLVVIAHLDTPLALLFQTPALQPLLSKVCGFYGVELFFVLSGYLMGPLFERVLTSSTRLTHFRVYLIRRWMRTLPLYYIALLIHIYFPLTSIQDVSLWPYFLFLQNLWWRMSGGSFFLVSWSLTVEEIFYIVFPVFALILSVSTRLSSRHILIATSLFLIAGCGVTRVITYSLETLWDDDVRRVALLRLDALAWGVLVFCFRDFFQMMRRSLISFLVIVSLALSMTILLQEGPKLDVLQKTILFPLTSLSLAMSTALFAQLERKRGIVAQVITSISLYSYSIYLFHWPILQYVNRFIVFYRTSPLLLIVVGLALIYCAGFVIYRFVEEPIMRRRPRE